MTTALLIVAVVVALACPVHMAWATRRGKRTPCCPTRPTSDVGVLRARQQALAAQLTRGRRTANDRVGASSARS